MTHARSSSVLRMHLPFLDASCPTFSVRRCDNQAPEPPWAIDHPHHTIDRCDEQSWED